MKRPSWIPDAVTCDLWIPTWANLFAVLINLGAGINNLFFGTGWWWAGNMFAGAVSAWFAYQAYRRIPERRQAMQDRLIRILRG